MSIDLDQRSIAGKFFGCEYCPCEFQFQQNRTQHTATHFKNKLCTICDKLLLCINGDWYELHAPGCVTEIDSQHQTNGNHINTIEVKADPFDFEYDLELKTEVSDPDSVDDVHEDYELFDSLSISEPDSKDNILAQSLATSKTIQTVSRASIDKSPVVKIQENGQSKLQRKNKSSAVKCNKPVSNKKPFTDHRPLGSCTCEICGSTLASFVSLRKHILYKHLNQGRVSCSECKKYFTTPGNLKGHRVRCHSALSKLKGDGETQEIQPIPQFNGSLAKLKANSSVKFENNQVLNTREKNNKTTSSDHQPSNVYKCKICKKTLANSKSLRRHTLYQHVRKPVSCDLCKKTFKETNNLKRHKISAHLPACPELEPLLLKAYFTDHRPTGLCYCDVCQKTFMKFELLKQHILRNHCSNNEQFPCDECDRTYTSRPNLVKHKNIHRNYKAYVCTFCGRGFNYSYALQEHEETHRGIIPSCTICGKQFARKGNLTKHMIIHSNERPFRCNVDGCKWAFTSKPTLTRHQARRHGMITNRNPCPICSKEFPDSTYHLKRHLEAHKRNTAKEYVPESKPTTSASTS